MDNKLSSKYPANARIAVRKLRGYVGKEILVEDLMNITGVMQTNVLNCIIDELKAANLVSERKLGQNTFLKIDAKINDITIQS